MKTLSKTGILTAVIATAMATGAYADTLAYNTSLADGYYNGTGNPNVGFTTLTTSDFELGLGTNIRFIAPVLPSPSNSAIYNVPTGVSGPPSGSKWDFEYSVDLLNGFSLPSGDHWGLTVTNAANSQTLSFDPSAVPDNTTNGHGFQNAENLGFSFFGILFPNFDYNPNQNDTFLVTLSLQDANNNIIAGLSETINQTPLPAALPLLAGGLGLLSLFGFRKRKAALAATPAAA